MRRRRLLHWRPLCRVTPLTNYEDKVSEAERAFEEHRAVHGELATQPDDPERWRSPLTISKRTCAFM